MRRASVVLLLFTTQCSWCAAPKPSPEDDPKDRDAAPHALEGTPRCEKQASIALPGALELGRVASVAGGPGQVTGARVLVGARRASRGGILEIDSLTARFTETSDAVGDSPPPLPVVSGEKILALAYEGAKRKLVLRDVASPAAAIVELPPEAPDESLAYDAAARVDGSIAIAWDAPVTAGSAIFATVVRGGVASPAVRLSPDDVDADSPRVLPLGPTILAMWIAHRPLPASEAGAAAEGPGQDLDHAWVELLPFDDTLHASAPLRHLTPDSGRVTLFDAIMRGGTPSARSAGPGIEVDVVARDAIELQAGQGGSALLVHFAGPEIQEPVVLADHVGRGLPLLASGLALYDDARDSGRAALAGVVSPEPTLDGSRALAVLPGGEVLVAHEGGAALDVVRCRN